MDKKIYIASGLKNYNAVLELRDKFAEHDINLSYDWAKVYKEHLENNQGEEKLQEIAELEYKGIKDCDVFFLLCPGGRGSHFELGVAYSLNKTIVLSYEEDYDPIAFYMLPGIKGFLSEDNAIEYVLEILNNEKQS